MTTGIVGALLLGANHFTFAADAIAPATKFDLLGWTLSVPVDEDSNGKADQIKKN